jgi:peptide chain release factor subunit 1
MVTGMPSSISYSAQLERLASFESKQAPVVSLYLNLQPDAQGRDRFEPFLKKELAERIRTFLPGPERASLERDAERVRDYLATVPSSLNGLALFACSKEELFEPIELAAPIAEHRLFVTDRPQLYPLARIIDAFPRYAVLVADTRTARIFVCAANRFERSEIIEGEKTHRHKMGGWSQARYQRHVDNFHLHHAKEVVDRLARIVRDERIESVVLAGDEVIMPLIRQQMTKELAARVVDVMKLDIRTPEHEILQATIEATRQNDASTDRQRAQALLDAYRANGLACAGYRNTLRALEAGQVDELLINADPATINTAGMRAGNRTDAPEHENIANELIAKAARTGAATRFIEDSSLLAAIGGVGAFLRYKA